MRQRPNPSLKRTRTGMPHMTSSPNSGIDWYMKYRDEQATSARAKGLPDGVFSIVTYNRVHLTGWPRSPKPNAIDPFDVFSNEPREVVEVWIRRANKLLASNYPVGDALVGRYPSFARLKEQFIAENPGFSSESYEYAIYLGAVAVR